MNSRLVSGRRGQNSNRAVLLVKSRVSKLNVHVLSELLLHGCRSRTGVPVIAASGGGGKYIILRVPARTDALNVRESCCLIDALALSIFTAPMRPPPPAIMCE